MKLNFKKIIGAIFLTEALVCFSNLSAEKAPKIDELFLDDNNEGIDDTYEREVEDSLGKLENISRIEKYIELSERLNKLGFDQYETIGGSSNKGIDDIDDIDIHQLEALVEKYEKEKSFEDYKELIPYNNVINDYLYNNGCELIGGFCQDIAKSIVIDVLDYEEGIEYLELRNYTNRLPIEPTEGVGSYPGASFCITGNVSDLVQKNIDLMSMNEDENKDFNRMIKEYKGALFLIKKAIKEEYDVNPNSNHYVKDIYGHESNLMIKNK